MMHEGTAAVRSAQGSSPAWPSSLRCGRRCKQDEQGSCLGQLMAVAGSTEHLSEDVIVDNMIAAAFGNASAGPTAAKLLCHLAAGLATAAPDSWVERLHAELTSQGQAPQKLPVTDAGALTPQSSPGPGHAHKTRKLLVSPGVREACATMHAPLHRRLWSACSGAGGAAHHACCASTVPAGAGRYQTRRPPHPPGACCMHSAWVTSRQCQTPG